MYNVSVWLYGLCTTGRSEQEAIKMAIGFCVEAWLREHESDTSNATDCAKVCVRTAPPTAETEAWRTPEIFQTRCRRGQKMGTFLRPETGQVIAPTTKKTLEI